MIIWTSPTLTQPAGRQIASCWSAFAARVADPRPGTTKEALSRWAPVEFRDPQGRPGYGYRCRANVIRAHAVVLDMDDGTPLDTITSAFEGLYLIMHSTFSATVQHPRWRIVLPLDRPVNADEYDRMWRWLASAVEAEGGAPDYNGRDVGHAWAVPATPPSGGYVARELDGSMACVADGLVAVPAPEPMQMPTRGAAGDEPYERRVTRARAYLERMPGGISGSGGHSTTFKAALAIVRGFALEADDALALMVEIHNPMCQPPWSIPDLRHKVQQALQRARVPFGHLADKRRGS
jgi:hypothetical protein